MFWMLVLQNFSKGNNAEIIDGQEDNGWRSDNSYKRGKKWQDWEHASAEKWQIWKDSEMMSGHNAD